MNQSYVEQLPYYKLRALAARCAAADEAGPLHIYVSDGNCHNGNLEFCLQQAKAANNASLVNLAHELLAVGYDCRVFLYANDFKLPDLAPCCGRYPTVGLRYLRVNMRAVVYCEVCRRGMLGDDYLMPSWVAETAEQTMLKHMVADDFTRLMSPDGSRVSVMRKGESIVMVYEPEPGVYFAAEHATENAVRWARYILQLAGKDAT